jgi:hypothetical protein
MKKQDCKHNRQVEKLKHNGQYGSREVYCTQCQRWVKVVVMPDPPRAGMPQDDD